MMDIEFGTLRSHLDLIKEDIAREKAEQQYEESQDKPKSFAKREEKMTKMEAYKEAEKSVHKTLHGEDVYAALNRTANAIGFMGKDQKNTYQNYDYRGIDGVYNIVGPALMKSGLVVLPTLLEHTVNTIQVTNKPTLQHFALVKYTCISTKDSSKTEVIVKGEAFDHSDKGLNKAMSAAYKLFAFQAFCIPLNGPSGDTESESLEITSLKKEEKKPSKTPTRVKKLLDDIGELSLDKTKRTYFDLLKKKYGDAIPEGIINAAKNMNRNDFTLAITNLEKEL
tara:strand:+ start:4843 stop:5685 length:843 start_codon:yes stop_codon:yes gene_type:complete